MKQKTTTICRRRMFLLAIAACGILLPRPSEAGEEDLAGKVFEMTGARTKIVWEHQVAGPGTNWDANTADYELVGFDTAEGKQRVILPGPASYVNPCFTYNGERVVFTESPNNKTYIVDWDGSNKRFLIEGRALCAWVDPRTKIEWLYYSEKMYGDKVLRCQIDDVEVKELIWDQTGVSGRFSISADGTRAGAEYPHPNAGVAILPNILWRRYGRGCNSCIAPDNSYRFFHMGGYRPHRVVLMYEDGGINRREVVFDNIPGRYNEDSWYPKWSTDVRFLTISSPPSGPYQELFIGKFNDTFTRVERWIQISNQRGQDVKAHAWVAPPGLGYHTGEAPFTVKIPTPDKKSEWVLDFGEAGEEVKARNTTVVHTYRKGGRYNMTAAGEGRTVTGTVHVYDAKPPAVTSATLLDDSHVMVAFDERVQLKKTRISLASGAAVKGSSLDEDGLVLSIELGGRIAAADSLRIKGVYDRSQVPKPLGDKPIPLIRPVWPTDRSGLVFLWETSKKRGFHYDGSVFKAALMTMRGRGRFDRFGTMSLQGGVIFAPGGGVGISSECPKAGEFTIEAVITPGNLYQGQPNRPHWIMACSTGRDLADVNFLLGQEGKKLALYLRQKQAGDDAEPSVKRVQLCALADQARNHVAVSYRKGQLVCYLNGKLVMQTDELDGALSWEPAPPDTGLSFGGGKGWGGLGYPPWRGKLEGIAVYSRALGAKEAAASFAAYEGIINGRPIIPRLELRAMLAGKSEVPAARDIAPYRDALVVYEYDVETILEGGLIGGTEETHRKKIAALLQRAKQFPVGPDALIEDALDGRELEAHVAANVKDDKEEQLRQALAQAAVTIEVEVPRPILDAPKVALTYDAERKEVTVMLNGERHGKPVSFEAKEGASRVAVNMPGACFIFEIDAAGKAAEAARFEKDYTVTFVAGATLATWTDLEVKINGDEHKWEQLLKGIDFDFLPETIEVSVAGTTPQGRRLSASFEIRPEEPEIIPAKP